MTLGARIPRDAELVTPGALDSLGFGGKSESDGLRTGPSGRLALSERGVGGREAGPRGLCSWTLRAYSPGGEELVRAEVRTFGEARAIAAASGADPAALADLGARRGGRWLPALAFLAALLLAVAFPAAGAAALGAMAGVLIGSWDA